MLHCCVVVAGLLCRCSCIVTRGCHPLGFYRGFWASLVTYAPSSAIWFATYEATKGAIYRQLNTRPGTLPESNSRRLQTGVHLLSGACAGLASVLITNPLDVAKTRLQTMDIANPHDAKLLR